jgi:hypothetical protein
MHSLNFQDYDAKQLDAMVNTPNAAQFLGVSPRCLEQYRIKGGGPQFVRISHRCIRYRMRDLLTYAQDRLRQNTAQE